MSQADSGTHYMSASVYVTLNMLPDNPFLSVGKKVSVPGMCFLARLQAPLQSQPVKLMARSHPSAHL